MSRLCYVLPPQNKLAAAAAAQAELARWMGPELIRGALFEKMRDAQKADVEALLAELPAGRPKPERLTRKEAAKATAAAAAAVPSSAAGEGGEAAAGAAASAAAVEEEPEQVVAAWFRMQRSRLWCSMVVAWGPGNLADVQLALQLRSQQWSWRHGSKLLKQLSSAVHPCRTISSASTVLT